MEPLAIKGDKLTVNNLKYRFGFRAKLLFINGILLLFMVLAFLFILWNLQKSEEAIILQRQDLQKLADTIERMDEAIKNQANTLQTLQTIEAMNRAFGGARYWYTDLAVSLLNDSETNAEASYGTFISLLEKLRTTNPEMLGPVKKEANKYRDFTLQAVDAYAEDNRVLGNSLISNGRASAVRISKLLVSSFQDMARQAQTSVLDHSKNAKDSLRRAQSAGDVVLATTT